MPRARFQRPEVRKMGAGRKQQWGADYFIYQQHQDCKEHRIHKLARFGLCARVSKGQAHRIATLNTVCVPEGVDEAKVRKRLLDEPGIEIAGGFGPLAGKIFRIGVMGPLATEDNVRFFLKEFKRMLS